MGHIYTKNLFIIDLKFSVTGDPVFLLANSGRLSLFSSMITPKTHSWPTAFQLEL